MPTQPSTILRSANPSYDLKAMLEVGTLTRLRTNTALVTVLLAISGSGAFGQVTTPAGSSCSTVGFSVDCPDPITSGDGIVVGSYGPSAGSTVEVTTNGIVSNQDGITIDMEGGTEHTVSVDNTGDIQAAGKGVEILVDSEGDGADVDVTIDGNITSGDRGVEVLLDEEGTINLTMTGNVVTIDDDAVGILASGGIGNDGGTELIGDGDITIVTTGNITTGGTASDAISASNDGAGDVSVTHTGDITTAASSSDGIDVFEAGAGNAIVTATGNITTLIAPEFPNPSDPPVVFSDGIEVDERGEGDAIITSNTNITTGTENGDGFSVEEEEAGNLTLNSTGDITVNFVEDAEAFEVLESGAGNLVLNSTGTIQADGQAFLVDEAGDGDLTTTIVGTVSAGGKAVDLEEDGTGNLALSIEGDVTAGSVGLEISEDGTGDLGITLTGDLTATSSRGMDVEEDGDGSITLTSTGNITSGNDGIAAEEAGAGGITIAHTGSIQAGADGVDAEIADGGGNLNVTVEGAISSAFNGITLDSDGYGSEVNVSQTGDIQTSDNFGRGIDIDILDHELGGTANVTLMGNITTAGDNSDAIEVAIDGSGDINVNATGDIATQGTVAYGISATLGELSEGSALGDITIISQGEISTQGDGATGITAEFLGQTGDISITHSGAISTTGALDDDDTSASGVSAVNYGDTESETTIALSGGVASSGVGAHAVQVASGSDVSTSVTLSDGDYVGGTIGEDFIFGAGLFGTDLAGSLDLVINEGASLSATSEVAIIVGNTAFGGTSSATAVTIENSGTIDGAALLSADSVAITNTATGTIEGAIATGGGNDAIINNGTITGVDFAGFGGASSQIDLGDGNNTFTSSANSTTTASISAGSGDDNFNINGAFTGNIDLGDGDNSLSMALSETGGFSVSLGGGNDQLTNLGIFRTNETGVSLGNGNNTFLNEANATFEGAISGGNGNDSITNFGSWSGRLQLGDGQNVFTNGSSGRFVASSGTIMSNGVDAQSTFVNSGNFVVGNSTVATEAIIEGSFVQEDTGALVLNFNLDDATSDSLQITGTGSVNGAIIPIISGSSSRTLEFTIVEAEGGLTVGELETVLDTNEFFFNLEYSQPDEQTLTLSMISDFAPTDENLNASNLSLGNALNEAGDLGANPVSQITDALIEVVGNSDEARAAYDQLGADAALKQELEAVSSGVQFTSNLMSCEQKSGQYAQIGEGQCWWFEPTGSRISTRQTDDVVGFNSMTWGLSGGTQFEVSENTYLGFALGYHESETETDAGGTNSSEAISFGAVAKHQVGPMLYALGLSHTRTKNESLRRVSFGGLDLEASSSPLTTTTTLQGRVQYLYLQEGYSLIPTLDFGMIRSKRSSYKETGAGVANLNVDASEHSTFFLSPSVEATKDVDLANGATVRLSANLGATWFSNTEFSTDARFSALPVGTGTFTTVTSTDRYAVDVGLGASWFFENGTNLNVAYQGQFSENFSSNSISAKFSYEF